MFNVTKLVNKNKMFIQLHSCNIYKCICLNTVETNQFVYVLQKSVAMKTGSSNICYEIVNNLLHAAQAERRVFSLIRPIYSN